MAINHQNILAKLKLHENVMYRPNLADLEEKKLRTGDVIKFGVEDFEKILRNFHVLRPLLESYSNNKKYKSNLWAILNKPCDMIHSDSQKFKANLFLCPLQSFRNELKGEHIFSEYISPPLGVKTPAETLLKIYKKFLDLKVKDVYPIDGDTPNRMKKELGQKRKEFVKAQAKWAQDEVFSSFEEIEKLEVYEKSLVSYLGTLEKENSLGEFSQFISFVKDLPGITKWKEYQAQYRGTVSGVDEVRINAKKTKALVQTVFINQMETQGMFYYEPHHDLYSKELCDFSYFIELEDLMTLKLDQEVIDNGELVELLQKKRLVGLTRNYSDRLQNIMGYFFSKIGTRDVKGVDVLGLYDECFETFHYDKDSL